MFTIIVGILFSFTFSLISLPILIKIAESNNLFVPRNYRRIHKTKISALGGIAIFTSSTIGFVLFSDLVNYPDYKYILSSGILMFTIGIRDDLHNIKALYKLTGQIASVSLLVAFAGVRINFLQHFIDGQLGVIADIISSIIIMVLIINSYNLIDGIDMLAASVGSVILGSLGLWFYLVGQYDFSLAFLTIAGSLLAFMIFNYSPAKIFMGDTGTLTIGLIMSIGLIKFEEISQLVNNDYSLHSAAGISFALISLIVFDLLRVAFIRMYKGISIFRADKRHIHHIMLRLGFRHNAISLIISSFIILQLLISIIADSLNVSNFGIIVLNTLLIFTFYTIIFYYFNKKTTSKTT